MESTRRYARLADDALLLEVLRQPGERASRWALLDSNQGATGYEPGALTAELRAPGASLPGPVDTDQTGLRKRRLRAW